jgi:hypothetical protein
MQARHLLSSAAIALIFCAGGAFASDEGCRTVVNGIQKCDVPSGREATRAEVVAQIHAKADTSTGCRSIVNGIQKCDVPTGNEASRDAVVAELHRRAAPSIDGCRTVVNGIQKCDLPSAYTPRRDPEIASSR